MNNQEVNQISKTFQVARPDFAVKMMSDFKKTVFASNINILDNTGNYVVVGFGNYEKDKFIFKVPAPTMQDVMNFLPQNIDYDTTYSLVVSKLSVHYENSLGYTKHNFMVVNNNIVNALCELYLSLKSAKVIL